MHKESLSPLVDLEKKNNYTFFLIGLGGNGSNLLSSLTQLLSGANGVYRIVLIDGDMVEAKNLRNQKFLRKDIGYKKVEVLQKRYNSIYTNLKIEYHDRYLKNKDILLDIIQECGKDFVYYTPIIIGTVDNDATRQLLNSVFESSPSYSAIYIDVGNGTLDDLSGQIVIGYDHCRSSVLGPVGSVFPEILENDTDMDKLLSCSALSVSKPQHIAVNLMASQLVLNEINNMINFDRIVNHIVYFDALKNEVINKEAFLEKKTTNIPVTIGYDKNKVRQVSIEHTVQIGAI